MKTFSRWMISTLLFLVGIGGSGLLLGAQNERREIPITSPAGSKEAVVQFIQGREAYESGHFEEARVLMDQAITSDPQFAIAYLYKAYLALNDPEWNQNIELALSNQKKVSEGEQILIQLENMLASRYADQRIKLANRLVSLYPLSSRAKIILANEFGQRGDFKTYRLLVQQSVDLNNNFHQGYRSLACSFLFHDPTDFDLALKAIQRYVELRPDDPASYMALGDVYRARLSLDLAEGAYSKAILLDPQSSIAYAKRGYANIYQGYFDQAQQDWHSAIRLNHPNNRIDWSEAGIVAYYNNDGGAFNLPPWNWKLRSFKESKHKVHPLEAPEDDHYFCCTVISMKHGVCVSPYQNLNEKQALERELTREALPPEANTIEANIRFMQCVNAIMQKDYLRANQIALDHAHLLAPNVNPSKLQVYNYLCGLIYLDQKQYAKALACYRKSDLKNNCVKYEMGLAYDGLGEWKQAQALFSEVAKCRLGTRYPSQMLKVSDNWLTTYSQLLEKER